MPSYHASNTRFGGLLSCGQSHTYCRRLSRVGQDVVLEPHEFSCARAGRGMCRRLQLPCKLAWSITIHKSQGASLDAARIDLSKVAAAGEDVQRMPPSPPLPPPPSSLPS